MKPQNLKIHTSVDVRVKHNTAVALVLIVGKALMTAHRWPTDGNAEAQTSKIAALLGAGASPFREVYGFEQPWFSYLSLRRVVVGIGCGVDSVEPREAPRLNHKVPCVGQ